jgi:hypothetical protein
METLSSKNSWAITDILARGKAHIICEALVDVHFLVPGSCIRRVGNRGVKRWTDEWDKGKGFDNDECFMRVYLDEEKLPTLMPMVDEITKKHEDADIPIPSTGVNLGTIDIEGLFGTVPVIDGMHRVISLVKVNFKWKLVPGNEAACNPYQYVRVVFYHPDVKPMMAVLAKASNDQKQVHVKEDGLERITLTHQIMDSYKVIKPGASELDSRAMAKHFMVQVGLDPEKQRTAVNYHCQLIGMAMAVGPEVTDWPTAKLQDLEAAGGTRAEVCVVF